jgi:enamine deaminase RidA (YjgF/YER057c/UK114 family)
MRRTILCALLIAALQPCLPAAGKKKKKPEEEITQTLEVLPDPPAAVTMETARLEYIVSPLSGKGLLSQQVRDALKALKSQSRGGQIMKLRAFVAGTGDQRRVASIVSEVFSEKRQPLPAVSTIQVGLLPYEGSQVVLEAAVQTKKRVNPNGLAFLSGMGGYGAEPPDQTKGMLEKAIADLSRAAEYSGGKPAGVIRVTCLLSSLAGIEKVRARLAAAFPSAAITTVQALRAHDRALAECEAVLRLDRKPANQLAYLNPAEMNPSPNYSKSVVVNTGQIVLTGSQMAFRSTDDDVRLAFQRMDKILEGAKTSMKKVVFSSIYPLTGLVTEKIRNLRFEFYDKEKPPASTMLLFEGLPSMDSSFALELVAVPEP